jgi:hypothetical protein
MQVRPDAYQERNALIPHLPEHNNQTDSWQSLPRSIHLKCKTESTLLSESWKGSMGVHASHSNELSIKRSHCSGNENEALAAKQSTIPTSGRRFLFIIKFL